MNPTDRSAEEWFALAEKCYLEKHQGCAWCGGSHRVFCQRQEGRISYSCQACDSRAVRDLKTNRCPFMPGDPPRAAGPDTMDSRHDQATQ